MKIEHELFAHHYILTGNKEAAYKKAYPHAAGESLKIAARKLINKPDVRQFIEQELAATREKVIMQYHEDEQQRLEEEYATMLLKRKKLREIIDGKKKQKKYFKFKDRIEIVEEDYSPFALMRAIELDTKIENEWYNRSAKFNTTTQPANEKKEHKPESKGIEAEQLWELIYGPDYNAGLRAATVRDNPYMAEEYRQKGLRVLDYVPNNEQIKQMKEDQERRYEEWRELKKFAEEHLDQWDTDETQYPDPASLPTIYPNKLDTTESTLHTIPNKTLTLNVSPLQGDRGKIPTIYPDKTKTIPLTNPKDKPEAEIPPSKGEEPQARGMST